MTVLMINKEIKITGKAFRAFHINFATFTSNLDVQIKTVEKSTPKISDSNISIPVSLKYGIIYIKAPVAIKMEVK